MGVNMNKPVISIIVPIYNVELYVEDCLKSVMNQSYDGHIECVVVDDCGTDGSMEIVEKLVSDYKGSITFKILHHTHNRGLSAARNTGMDAAIGDYFFFLDSDDELTVDCIEKLVEPLNENLYDVVVGNVRYVNVNIQGMKEFQVIKLPDKTLLTPPFILRTYQNGWGQAAWNRLYRKNFIRKKNIYFKEGLLFEDNLWSFQIASLASSVFLTTHTTYIHKKIKSSITGSTEPKLWIKSHRDTIKYINSFAEKQHIKSVDIFPVYNTLFATVLSFCNTSLSDYVSNYLNLRPYIYTPKKTILKTSIYSIKSFLQNIHYYLPLSIAPYWQYYTYERIHGIVHFSRRILQS